MAQAGDAIRVFRDPTAEFGTLGCVLAFQDDDDPRRFLLTCSHVLAPPGFPTPGPDVYDNFGTTIARTIGTSEIVREHIDVALAELLVPCNPAIRTVGMPVGWATQIASGDTLRGCGARSGIVLGTQIISPNQSATIEVLDSSRNPISLRLNDHIIANNVGFLPGDSGCALVDDFHFVVGLFVGFAQDKTVVIGLY